VRHILFLLSFALLALTQGQACDLKVELTNAPPTATWLQAEPMSDGVVDLTLWVYDLEQAPVDVEISWSLDGVEQGALELAPGGQGTLGLTTSDETLSADGRPNPDGQAHLIRWALPQGSAENARVQLHVRADDRESEPSAAVSSPAEGFVLSEGSGQVLALKVL